MKYTRESVIASLRAQIEQTPPKGALCAHDIAKEFHLAGRTARDIMLSRVRDHGWKETWVTKDGHKRRYILPPDAEG